MYEDVIAATAVSTPRTANERHRVDWQAELAAARMTISDLMAHLNIPETARAEVLEDALVPPSFPLLAPPRYLEKIRHGDPSDPLLRQILPLEQELESASGYTNDPLNESKYNPVPGLIHKYQSRVLLTITSKCAIHCRYCFRREFPYEENNPGKSGWQQVLTYIRSHPEISEVIFSGGDPLSASDKTLAWLTKNLSEITTVKYLRIHSRLPVVIPSRINEHLLSWLQNWKGKKIVVLHCNHPAELDEEVSAAIQKLTQAGATVLNQSVLLRGVNDDASVLASLSHKLFEAGALPYYLHLLDKVRGTHQFFTETQRARAIYCELSALLPGYLLPKLAHESAGNPAKTVLSNFLEFN